MGFKANPTWLEEFLANNAIKRPRVSKTSRIAKFRGSAKVSVKDKPSRGCRPKVRKHLERDLQQNIFHELSKYPEIRRMSTASANGEKRSKATGAVLKSMGVTAGWPDIQIMIPQWCDNLKGYWHGFFYECKAPGKKASKEQQKLLLELGRWQYYAVCGDSLEDFLGHMSVYFGENWREVYGR